MGKTCKVLRKLAVAEILTLLEGPVRDEESGVTRIKCKALKDELEGWVTTKGNAGTTYAEVSAKLYTVLREMPLQKVFASSSTQEVRKLAEGEAIHVIEGPKPETH